MKIYLKIEGKKFKRIHDNYLEQSLSRAFNFGEYVIGHCGRTLPKKGEDSELYRIIDIIGYDDNFPGTELYLEKIEEPIIIKE